MHGVQQGLQHGGRAHVAHAKPSQESDGTGQLAANLRPVVQVLAVHANISKTRRVTGITTVEIISSASILLLQIIVFPTVLEKFSRFSVFFPVISKVGGIYELIDNRLIVKSNLI